MIYRRLGQRLPIENADATVGILSGRAVSEFRVPHRFPCPPEPLREEDPEEEEREAEDPEESERDEELDEELLDILEELPALGVDPLRDPEKAGRDVPPPDPPAPLPELLDRLI